MGGDEIFVKIKEWLEKEGVDFRVYEHVSVRTSQEAAEVRGTKLAAGTKALVMKADGEMVMLVVPGDKKVDFGAFKRQFGVDDLRMATVEEVKEVTGVEVGGVPPTGNLWNLPTYFDRGVEKEETVVFNAGRRDKSVEMKREDLVRWVRPVWGEFSQ